jgi:glycosidase/MoaA/NifB/PqqE/SkfB family radical SAM enzyme
MEAVGKGVFEARLPVRTGTYEYKFRLRDGTWFLDPNNGRTRSLNGNRNSLLVVGGCEEPVLHAPAPPYLFREEDGRVCVRAGLRRGAGDGLSLRWDEGHGLRQSRMTFVGEEDEHLLFEGHAAGSGRRFEYVFQLGEGGLVGRAGGPGLAFSVELDALGSTTPAWWKDAVIYTVFLDRFRPGGDLRAWPRPSDRAHFQEVALGGDLAGVIQALPYLRDLGVTVLHLTPMVVAGSCHRYDAIDPRQVDPGLGGPAMLEGLLEASERCGMHVLFDLTLTHVHMDFPPFRDVVERGKRSRHFGWFRIHAHPFRQGPGVDTGYEHYQKGRWQEPLLRLEEPEVLDYLRSTIVHWAKAGVEAFRFDAVADVPLALVQELVSSVRAVRPDALLLGEVTVDNAHAWTGAGLDAVTDFGSQQVIYDLVWRRTKTAATCARQLAAQSFRRPGPGWRNVTFTATHDQPRLLSFVRDAAIARMGHLLALLRPSIPALYYGDEIGLSSEDTRDFEGVWPDRAPMIWDPAAWDQETRQFVRDVLRLRRRHAALSRGSETFGVVRLAQGDELAQDVLWLRRTSSQEVFDVLMNVSDHPCRVALPSCHHEAVEEAGQLGLVRVGDGCVELGKWSAVILRRVPSESSIELAQRSAEHGDALVDLAFREGSTEAAGLPRKLYLTVTERCQLRCLHCINHSPARTRAGTARDMPPWVMDRLQEAFASAEYVAFSHGGESLLSPALFEVLDRVKRARASRSGRCDIHLLTNGMLLTPARLRSLIELGVTSLAVSVDGPTSEIHDAIRCGSRLATVIEHVREAVRLRDAGADLRIGLSTVLSEANVEHGDALGRLVLDLGVDWLKVEEMVPVNGFARQQMIEPDDARAVDAIVRLRALLEPASVVLVNHMVDRVGCDCHGASNPVAKGFRRADNFANRVRLLPCRMPWDTACIDPDGTVHPVSYESPSVGHLLWDDLLDIWDGEAARRVRAEALRPYPEAVRAGCPEDAFESRLLDRDKREPCVPP